MDASFISALAALAGAAIGGLRLGRRVHRAGIGK